MFSRKDTKCPDPKRNQGGCVETRRHTMKKFNDRFGRGCMQENSSIASRPVVSAAVTRQRSANVSSPNDHQDVVREHAPCNLRKPPLPAITITGHFFLLLTIYLTASQSAIPQHGNPEDRRHAAHFRDAPIHRHADGLFKR